MNLITEQSAFADNVAQLIQFIRYSGYTVSFGEAYRPVEMQKIYYDKGSTKTMDSQHLKRLAVDLNFFKPMTLELTYAKTDLQQFGDYWESLDVKNKWGGNWEFMDTPHFERKV